MTPEQMAEFEAEFEREIMKDDDSAARMRWAKGLPIHISREDTPPGYIIRVYPDQREELIWVDWDEMRALLGE